MGNTNALISQYCQRYPMAMVIAVQHTVHNAFVETVMFITAVWNVVAFQLSWPKDSKETLCSVSQAVSCEPVHR